MVIFSEATLCVLRSYNCVNIFVTYLESVEMITHLLQVCLINLVLVSILRVLHLCKLVDVLGHLVTNCADSFDLVLALAEVLGPVSKLSLGHLLTAVRIGYEAILSAEWHDFVEQILVLCRVPGVVGALVELIFSTDLVQLNLHVGRVIDRVDLESILGRQVWLVILKVTLSRHIIRLFKIVDTWRNCH